ncbi:MAG TPA: hypothetical protein VN840_22535, partial [Streptosporangiaceae bacterium]|nr:hypothetical protein [Streptosporangiaceae bacterium]
AAAGRLTTAAGRLTVPAGRLTTAADRLTVPADRFTASAGRLAGLADWLAHGSSVGQTGHRAAWRTAFGLPRRAGSSSSRGIGPGIPGRGRH